MVSLANAWLPGDHSGEARWAYLGGRPFHDAAGYHDWLHRQSPRRNPACMAVAEANTGDTLGVAAWLNG